MQHVGAVLGQYAGVGRPREHTREVEHPHAAERRRRVTNRDRAPSAIFSTATRPSGAMAAALRMRGPLVGGAHHRPACAGFDASASSRSGALNR